MQLARFLQATDWSAAGAVYNSAYLDTVVNVSTYGHPAVVGTVTITSTDTFTGGQAFTGSPALPADIHSSTFGPGGNLWSQVDLAAMTTQAGDTYSFSTTARRLDITFAGIVASGLGFVSGGVNLTSGALRNGAVATISLDGVVVDTVDTYGAAPTATLYLDGARHTILITHTGGYNTQVRPITIDPASLALPDPAAPNPAKVYYVDGKLGSDSNTGTTPGAGNAFKTINKAVSSLPAGSAGQAAGWTVVVRGYTDYSYRERAIPPGTVVSGTSGSPLVFTATGFSYSHSYTQAAVDGAAVVASTAQSVNQGGGYSTVTPSVSWTQPNAGTYPNVWMTPWPTALTRGDAKIDYTNTERADRIWLNSSLVTGLSIPLRRPVPGGGAGTAITLADLNTNGFSYFFDAYSASGTPSATAPGGARNATGYLYVNLSRNSTATGSALYPAPSSTNPTLGGNQLEVPCQSTLYFDNACNNVIVHGFKAWHGDLGISLKNGCNGFTVENNDASYNFDMGFACIGGGSGTQVHDITLQSNTATGNSIQAVKCDGYTYNVTARYNDFFQNCLQDGFDLVAANVHDITISNNAIHDGNLMPTYNRYRSVSNQAISGILLEDGCTNIIIRDNHIYNQSNGIATYVTSAAGFTATISGNYIHDEVHTASDSGFAISFGDPGANSEAGTAVSFVGNAVVSCDGGGTGANGGIYFYYGATGKTIASTSTTAPSPLPLTVRSGVGLTVFAGLSLTALFHPTFISASWRLLATDTSHYTLFRTLPGGSETTIATGLLVGTTYADTAHVPGVSLVVTGTLAGGDSATFSTDVTQVAFATVAAGYSSGGGGSGISYQSPVLDSQEATTQWFIAEWVQGAVPALGSLTWRTGQTPTPDAMWSTTTLTPTNTVLPDSLTPMGVAGLMAAPRGRYAQFTANFAVGTGAVPFIRDLIAYYWVPERDPQFMSKMAFADAWQPGPTLTGYFGALACELASTRQKALDYVNSAGIPGAVDQYLAGYGADFGLPQWTGEQQTTYRARLLSARQLASEGGSLVFIQQEVALLTGFAVSAIGVVATGSYGFTVTIPPPVAGTLGTFYPNLLGIAVAQAQQMITDFVESITPVTSIPTTIFN